MKKVIFVILEHYADWEPAFLSAALSGEVSDQYQVLYASTDRQPKTSIGQLKALPDLTLDEIPADAAALILIGASGSWRAASHSKIAELAHTFLQNGRVVCAICDAAYFAGVNGLLNHHRHTLNSLDEMEGQPGYTNKANYLKEEAVVDGGLVTANGNAPVQFAAHVLRALQAADEFHIQQFQDFYSLGFHAAMHKYGYDA